MNAPTLQRCPFVSYALGLPLSIYVFPFPLYGPPFLARPWLLCEQMTEIFFIIFVLIVGVVLMNVLIAQVYVSQYFIMRCLCPYSHLCTPRVCRVHLPLYTSIYLYMPLYTLYLFLPPSPPLSLSL